MKPQIWSATADPRIAPELAELARQATTLSTMQQHHQKHQQQRAHSARSQLHGVIKEFGTGLRGVVQSASDSIAHLQRTMEAPPCAGGEERVTSLGFVRRLHGLTHDPSWSLPPRSP